MYTLKNPTGAPSEKAFGYLVSLINEAFANHPTDRQKMLVKAAGFNAKDVAATIDILKNGLAATKAQAAKESGLALLDSGQSIEGKYLVNGTVYVVKVGKGSGAPYLLTDDGQYIGAKKGDAPAILAAIKANGHELAMAYGKATGTCGMCNTALTHPKSVAAGIGPWCSEKYFGIKIY